MAELTARRRNQLPKSQFGLPGSERYPMPDKAHAANAKARATQMVNAGKLSESSAAKIRAKADRILGESAGGKRNNRPSTGPRVPGSRSDGPGNKPQLNRNLRNLISGDNRRPTR